MLPSDAELLLPLDPVAFAVVGADIALEPALDRLHYDAYRSRRGVHLLPHQAGLRRATKRIAARFRWHRAPDDDVTVAGRGRLVPAVISAAGPHAVVRQVSFDTDQRRRAAFVVGRSGRTPDSMIVKVARARGEGARGAVEQRRMSSVAALGLAARVPRPLGHGEVREIGWSAESLEPGVPMARASTAWRRRHATVVLDRLATWLGDLAAATAHPRSSAPAGDHLPLRGTALERVGPLLDDIAGVACVTCHGDLASGENVLVRRRSFIVIDWETAVDDGVPLVDLLPTLTLGLARVHGGPGPAGQAEYALRLSRGQAPESPWLFGRVATYLDRLDISCEKAGDLAALAWGYQASMRARHDELLRTSGHEPHVWTSPAELILRAWLDDDELGDRWRAFAQFDGGPRR